MTHPNDVLSRFMNGESLYEICKVFTLKRYPEKERRFAAYDLAESWLRGQIKGEEPTDYVVDQAPIPLVLFCPRCFKQHIDEPKGDWDNPPHKTHACEYCGHHWRPCDRATTGVKTTNTFGKTTAEGDAIPL